MLYGWSKFAILTSDTFPMHFQYVCSYCFLYSLLSWNINFYRFNNCSSVGVLNFMRPLSLLGHVHWLIGVKLSPDVYRLCKRQQDLKLIKWCLQMHHFYFLLGRYSQNNNSLVAVVLLQTEAKKILVLPCLYQGFKINLSSGKQVIHVTSHNLGLWKLNETNFRKSVQPSLLCKLINHYSFFKLQLIVSKFKICLPGFPKSSEKQKTSQLLICN